MLSWVKSRWREIGESWRECLHLEPPGYRVDAVPTSDEMAARCKDAEALAARLVIERDRLQRKVGELEAAVLVDRGFPGLTPGQVERLALLAEECGEVIQAVGKVLRHGYDGQNPYRREPLTNRVGLERELGDFHTVLGLMYGACDVRSNEIHTWKRKKERRVGQWLHHQSWTALRTLETQPAETDAGGEQAR